MSTNLITNYITKRTENNYSLSKSSPDSALKTNNSQNLKDEFVKEHKKNGLFERFYNFLKNKTGFGLGSKKIEQEITEFENGIRTEDEVKSEITKYRASQKNSQQLFGDTLSSISAIGAYFTTTNVINKFKALTEANGGKLAGIIGQVIPSKYAKPIEKSLKNLSKFKVGAIGVGMAMCTGEFIKSFVLNLNSIGSKEFKYDKKNTTKKERKAINKARRKDKRKNSFTGALNGLLAPLTAIAGGVVGVPAFIAANFGLRYLTQNKEGKSLKDFGEKLKDNATVNTAAAALIAIPLYKKASFTKVLNQNLEKVVAKLKDVEFVKPFKNSKTAYTQIEEILVGSEKIQSILNNGNDYAQQIQKITDQNIFAAKFIQISNNYGEISNVLRENCPTTRTIEEAAEYISKTFGNKYTVSKQLGVGTVAETYLAKDVESGKEVCIKILKKGINDAKIDADKQKLIDIIKSQVTDTKEQEYLLKNIEDLASGIRNEVDFTKEMEAAKELTKYTKKANVVKPVEVKNNIYIMEKANGISLKTLEEAIEIETKIKIYKRYNPDSRELQVLEEKLAEIKSKSPDFNLTGINDDMLQKMLHEYIGVNVEQFNAINKNGKVLHADIHPGNIFIDLDALKSGKGKLLTLIDTGNTVNMSRIQSENALKLTEYIRRGNVKDITKYVLDGATLPDGMTQEKAIEIVEKELKKCFFDNKTKLELLTNNSLLELTSNIMREYNILPASTQLNFEKAKTSAIKSFTSFIKSFVNKKFSNIDIDSKTDITSNALKMTKDFGLMMYKYKSAEKVQDLLNLYQLGTRNLFKSNPNMLKTNSEDYLTYTFKQQLDSKSLLNMY